MLNNVKLNGLTARLYDVDGMTWTIPAFSPQNQLRERRIGLVEVEGEFESADYPTLETSHNGYNTIYLPTFGLPFGSYAWCGVEDYSFCFYYGLLRNGEIVEYDNIYTGDVSQTTASTTTYGFRVYMEMQWDISQYDYRIFASFVAPITYSQ